MDRQICTKIHSLVITLFPEKKLNFTVYDYNVSKNSSVSYICKVTYPLSKHFQTLSNFSYNQKARIYIQHPFTRAPFVFTYRQLKVNTNFQTEFNKFAHQTRTAESSQTKQKRLLTYVQIKHFWNFATFLFPFRTIETDAAECSKSLVRFVACAWREKCVRRTDARGRENNGVGRYDTLRHAPDGFPDRAVIWRRGASAARRVQVNGKNPV